MLKRTFALASLVALSEMARGATAPVAQATIAPWGLDLAAKDASIRPGADFYRFANGHWLSSAKIPADQTSWSAFAQLNLDSQRNVQIIIQSLPQAPTVGSVEQKIAEYYRAYWRISRIGPARFRVNGPTLHGLPAEPRFESFTRPFSLRQVFAL